MVNNIQVGEKLDTPRNNANLPQARSYEHFRDILKEAETDPLVQKKINSTDDFIVRPDKTAEDTWTVEIYNKDWVKTYLCYIVGTHAAEEYVSKYFSEEVYLHQQEVKIQLIKEGSDRKIITGIRKETWELKDRLINYPFNKESVKNFFKDSNENIKRLEDQYKHRSKEIKNQQKKKLKTSKLENEMFGLLEFAIQESEANVKRLDVQLNNLQKEYNKWLLDEPTRKAKTQEMRTALMNHFNNQSEIGSVTNKVVSTSDNILPDIDIKLPITWSNHAKEVQKVYTRMAIERIITNNHTLEADLRKIQGQHGEKLYEYLKNSLDTGVTAEEFKPVADHQAAFDDIKAANPEIAKYLDSIVPNVIPHKKTDKNKTPNKKIDNPSNNTNGQEIYNDPRNIEKYKTNKPKWLLDEVTFWPLTDFIDNRDRNPDQKKAAKTVAGVVSLAAVAGIGIMAVKKIWKLAFSKEKMDWKDRWWLLWWAGLFATTAIVSWWNPLDLKSLGNSIWGLWWDSENLESNNPNASPETLMTDWMNTMNMIFGGMTGSQINSLLIKEDGKTKIDYNRAKTFMEVNKSTIANADRRIQIIETLENSPNQNIIHLWIQALWLSKEKLANNPNKKYDELVEKGLTKFFTMVYFMDKNQYTKWNPDMTDHIYAYMRWESWRTTEKLAKVWAFERQETLEDNDAIKNNIDSITLLDDNQKNELYAASLKVYKELREKTNYLGNFEFIEKSGKLHLKTYDKETPIDLTKNQLGNIPLYTTYQTLKAANLTNRLQDLFQWESDTDKPFNISWPGRDIEFQKSSLTNVEWRKKPRQFIKDKFDTEAVAAWWGGTLNNIAPSLEDNKQAYVDYLNSLPGRKK